MAKSICWEKNSSEDLFVLKREIRWNVQCIFSYAINKQIVGGRFALQTPGIFKISKFKCVGYSVQIVMRIGPIDANRVRGEKFTNTYYRVKTPITFPFLFGVRFIFSGGRKIRPCSSVAIEDKKKRKKVRQVRVSESRKLNGFARLFSPETTWVEVTRDSTPTLY